MIASNDISVNNITFKYIIFTAAIFLLLNITLKHSTLHSRVKDSITHNSIVTLSSNFKEDLYGNVNFVLKFL